MGKKVSCKNDAVEIAPATLLPAPAEKPAVDLATSYAIKVEPDVENDVVNIKLIFELPLACKGMEYASFKLPYTEAGVLARKIESARKKLL